MFGQELKLEPGQAFALGIELKSLAGIRRADLIGAGVAVAGRTFADLPRATRVEFAQSAGASAWYALVVEDRDGRRAYTNPVWIDAGGAQ
jgi:hypothetical protein